MGCVTLTELKEDVGHLFNADVYLSEMNLICMRSPVPLIPNGLICGTHQFSLCTYYRPSILCKCDLHSKNSKAKGIKVSWKLYNFVKDRDASFILGSLICKSCQLKLQKMLTESEMECEELKDPSFVPLESTVNDNERMIRQKKLDALSQIFEIVRVRFQLKTDISIATETTLNYFRNIHQQFKKKIDGYILLSSSARTGKTNEKSLGRRE